MAENKNGEPNFEIDFETDNDNITTTYEQRRNTRRQRRIEEDEFHEQIKDHPNKRKKPESDSDKENITADTGSPDIWPRFLVIEDKNPEETALGGLTPFAVTKYTQALIGTVGQIKKLRSGSLLVEATTKNQSKRIQQLTQFANISVKVSPHNSLNKRKGVIRCADFKGMTEGDLQKELEREGITEVKRITIFRDGKKENTNTFILSFGTPNLPKFINAGYLRLPVSTYIPNPLRCFKCQRYGHHQTKCRGKMTCQRCSEEGHDNKECHGPLLCKNCKGSHPANSKTCPTWIKEKEIIKIKTERNIPFPEARRLCELRNAAGPVTYARAAAASSANKPTASTKTMATQTTITWPQNSDTYSLIETNTTQTQTSKPIKHQNQKDQKTAETSKPAEKSSTTKPTKKIIRHKPGPVSSKSGPRSNKGKTLIIKKPKHNIPEIELSNRFNSLSSSEGEEDGMEITPPDPPDPHNTERAAENSEANKKT